MPSLDQALNADLSGYTQVENVQPKGAPPPINMQPGRSSTMRCPLPILSAATPDALRSFYLDGKVPQVRFLTPQATVSSISSTTSGNTSSSTSSSSSSTTLLPKQATITTAVLAPSAKFTGLINLAKSFQLLSMAVDGPARVELYGTATAQSSDLARGLDIAPAAGTAQNIICDVVLDTVNYQWTFQNRVGANGDTTQTANVYVTITNISTSARAVTLTLSFVPIVT